MSSDKPGKQNTKITLTKQELYVGPVPDPDSLAKYESIQPGFANRLIAMAEKEQSERHASNRLVIENESQLEKMKLTNFKRGQYFGFFALLVIVALCVYAMYLGHPIQAAWIAVAVITTTVVAFISGRLKKGSPKLRNHTDAE